MSRQAASASAAAVNCPKDGMPIIARLSAVADAPTFQTVKPFAPNAICGKAIEMMTFEKLRTWQKRFVRSFRAWKDPIFLMVALPGGGKTIAALFAAKEWLAGGTRQRFVVVVVPSRNLKRQWKRKAWYEFGLQLQTKEFEGELKANMAGCVMTYAAIASEALLYRRLCARHEILVIFDEVHHVGESAAWGEGIREGFEGANKRLAMSGTPWRSDGGQIPFLICDPETGEYEHHENFDWLEALEEEPPCVRTLSMRPYHGHAEYEHDNKVIKLNSRDRLSDDDTARCLRGRLFEQLFCTDVLRDAHAKLIELRERKPDAAGIVVCVDIDHAVKVARWLRVVTGEEPIIAVSDDDVAPGEPIEAFGADGATAKWIVSVRQVSEGVDIPRLVVGVYLTNFTTELFFRQFIGRIARNQGTKFDKEAYVFYPYHPRLNEYAEKILELQAIAIQRREDPGIDYPGPGGKPTSAYNYLGGSEAESAGLILPNAATTYGPVAARTVTEFARTYGIDETTAARILRDQPPQPDRDEDEPSNGGKPLEDRLDDLRKRQSRRIGYWARLSGVDHKTLNGEANRHAGCGSIDTATEEQLERRAVFIETKIRETRTNGP